MPADIESSCISLALRFHHDISSVVVELVTCQKLALVDGKVEELGELSFALCFAGWEHLKQQPLSQRLPQSWLRPQPPSDIPLSSLLLQSEGRLEL